MYRAYPTGKPIHVIAEKASRVVVNFSLGNGSLAIVPFRSCPSPFLSLYLFLFLSLPIPFPYSFSPSSPSQKVGKTGVLPGKNFDTLDCCM